VILSGRRYACVQVEQYSRYNEDATDEDNRYTVSYVLRYIQVKVHNSYLFTELGYK
jgi:hypothetical protein